MLSPSSRLAMQQCVDDARHPVPRVFFPGELTPPCRRDGVKSGLAIGLRSAPLPAEQATLLQPHQCGIQRAHIELQRAARHLLKTRGNGVAV